MLSAQFLAHSKCSINVLFLLPSFTGPCGYRVLFKSVTVSQNILEPQLW